MTEDGRKQIKFRVQRYDPERDIPPHFEEFIVPSERGMTVLDGLLYIKENLDSSLAFRTSCRMGICGSCGMLVNDYPHLACHTQIEEFHSNVLRIKSLPNLSVIKDLVPELRPLFDNHKLLKPYIIRADIGEMERPTAEFVQSPKELEAFLQFTYCIKCGICISACPTSASDKLYLGPQALAQCYRYCADSRDSGEEERFPLVDMEHGIWHCHFAGACSEACPKGLDPALAIQFLRRWMVAKTIKLGKKKQPSPVAPLPVETKPKISVPEFTVKNTGQSAIEEEQP